MRGIHEILFSVLLAYCALASVGCEFARLQSKQYETVLSSPNANATKAKALNEKGLWHFNLGHFEKAETYFQESLVADVSFGPAHNSLGMLYVATQRLYLAAWEFEYASKLMPHRAEPIINQGMVYELAQQNLRALEFYEMAYDQFPANSNAIASLSRILVKSDGDKDRIRFVIGQLILYSPDAEEVAWAKELLATRYRENGETPIESKMQFPVPSGESGTPVPSTLEAPELELLPPPQPMPIKQADPLDLGLYRIPGAIAPAAHYEHQPLVERKSIQQVSWGELLMRPSGE